MKKFKFLTCVILCGALFSVSSLTVKAESLTKEKALEIVYKDAGINPSFVTVNKVKEESDMLIIRLISSTNDFKYTLDKNGKILDSIIIDR